MAEQLKNIYNQDFFINLAKVLAKTLEKFDQEKFLKLIFDKNWKNLELKARTKQIAHVFHHFLPKDFKLASKYLIKIIKTLKTNDFRNQGYEFMFLPDYIELYGINDYPTAIKTIEFVTQFTSCEFAVRPFILKYKRQMLKQMFLWSLHKNEYVRRLASEGIRPRLPWSFPLKDFKKDPKPVLKILENLKNDPSETVRRSVANNLNDISKDHPKVLIQIAKKWSNLSKNTDKLIKHAARTLLKKGDPEILKYYKFNLSNQINIKNFKLEKTSIKINEYLNFSFTLNSKAKASEIIRLEYAIYFLRKNKSYAKKVFKISEKEYFSQGDFQITSRQSFKTITTRRYYPGKQKISIIVNGQEKELKDFNLN